LPKKLFGLKTDIMSAGNLLYNEFTILDELINPDPVDVILFRVVGLLYQVVSDNDLFHYVKN